MSFLLFAVIAYLIGMRVLPRTRLACRVLGCKLFVEWENDERSDCANIPIAVICKRCGQKVKVGGVEDLLEMKRHGWNVGHTNNK